MRLYTILAVSVILSLETFSQNTFNLEIKICNHNPNNTAWRLNKLHFKSGFTPFDFINGKSNMFKVDYLETKDSTLEVHGYIQEPGLYRLINLQEKKSFDLMMEAGENKITIDWNKVEKTTASIRIFPFIYYNSTLNDELQKFGKSNGIQEYLKLYKNYTNWFKNQFPIVYGITYSQYLKVWQNGSLQKYITDKGISKEKIKLMRKEQKARLSKTKNFLVDVTLAYIKTKPNSVMGLNYFVQTAYVMNRSNIKVEDRFEHLSLFGKELLSNSLYLDLKSTTEALEKIKIGSIAPDFKLEDPNGTEISLSDFRGNYVLVEFWASDCNYCADENENLKFLYNKYGNEDFEILSVSFDEDKNTWNKSLKKQNSDWIHIREPKGFYNSEIAIQYEDSSIPYYFLIDKEGKIIAKRLRQPKVANNYELGNLNLQLEKIFNY
jgi:peroxiredoxin